MKIQDTIFTDWQYGQKFRFTREFFFRRIIQYANYLEGIRLGLTKEEAKKASRFSHVGKIVEITKNKVVVAEALFKGYCRYEYDKEFFKQAMKDGKIEVKTNIKKMNSIDKEFFEKYQGRDYSVLDIVRSGISTIFRLIPFSHKLFMKMYSYRYLRVFLDSASDNKVICTEINAIYDYNQSNGKIDYAEEFGLDRHLLMPIHLYISKYHRDNTNY